MNKIFYIMGKSASGKDKIFNQLLEQEELGLHRLITYTTRPRRYDEIDGIDYFFVDQNKLEELKSKSKIIEQRSYHTVYGIWDYFTADDGQIRLNENGYLGVGTLESYERMKEYFGNEIMRPVYIDVEDGERLERALKREKKEKFPKYAEICRRFLSDCEDFSEEKIARAGIKHRFKNIKLEECIIEIIKYIQNEK